MIIHVVQLGDTLTSIAESYGISINSLIINNGIQNPNDLVEGRCIVIVYGSRGRYTSWYCFCK